MINFVCVYYGNKYSFPYVKNLHNMVERNLTTPHKFICFTDNTVIAQRKEFRSTNIEFRQFKRHDFNGWFNKLQLFSPDSNLDGNTLYMDLDVVIMKNIECFGYLGDSKNFVGMNDFNPTSGVFNSSIMKFNQNKMHDKLWRRFIADRPNLLRTFISDIKLLKTFLSIRTFPPYLITIFSFLYFFIYF